MRAWSALIVAGALFGPRRANAEPGGAVDTAVKFFEARQAANCNKVWPFYSAGTQENIRALAHRRERERAGLPQPPAPEQMYCGRRGTLKRGSVRIVRQQGDETVVAGEFVVRHPRHYYDFFPSTGVETDEIRLVREGGAWRVELPRQRIGPGPDRRLVEVGPVDVYHPAKSFWGLADRVEATAVVRASRDTLEPALRDPQSWARALPSVKAAQPLPRAGDLERVELSFAAPDRSLTVTTQLFAKQVDQPLRETTLQWNAEGANKAPVYFRGSWKLEPHQDGSTRVTLLLLVIPNQWPGDVTEESFSAERMARAVLALEKAALAPAP